MERASKVLAAKPASMPRLSLILQTHMVERENKLPQENACNHKKCAAEDWTYVHDHKQEKR